MILSLERPTVDQSATTLTLITLLINRMLLINLLTVRLDVFEDTFIALKVPDHIEHSGSVTRLFGLILKPLKLFKLPPPNVLLPGNFSAISNG